MASRSSTGTGAGKIVLIVLGAVALIVGLAFAAGGGVVLVAQSAFRDAEGFFVAGPHPFDSAGYAITSKNIDLGANPERGASDIGGIFTLRLRADSTNGSQVFIGIARSADVDSYLSDVDHDEITDVSLRPFRATYQHLAGSSAPRAPTRDPIWVQTVWGPGEQTLIWHPRRGQWTVVIMNADGARGVSASLSVGVRVRYLMWIGVGLLVLAAVAWVAGGLMLYFGVRQPKRGAPVEPVPAETPAT